MLCEILARVQIRLGDYFLFCNLTIIVRFDETSLQSVAKLKIGRHTLFDVLETNISMNFDESLYIAINAMNLYQSEDI